MDMQKPTAILSEEHKNILKVINALLQECNSLESGNKLDRDFFKKAVDFIRNYADRFHHAKEEDILFTELCKNTAKMRCNPVQQMLYEHDLGRKFVKGIEAGLKEDDKAQIIKNTRGYSQLLQEHIFKEDNILYPMADEALNPQAQKTILNKFRQAERKKFKRNKGKYLSIAKEFEKRLRR